MDSTRLVHTLASVLLTVSSIGMLHGDAQRPSSLPRIVYLGHVALERDPSYPRFLAAVRRYQPQLLTQYRFEFAGTPDDPPRQQDAIRGIVADRPAMVVAPNGNVAIAARHAASGVPMVFSSYLDPVRFGIVPSLQQRVEPIAGVWISDQLDGKRLEVLRDAYPKIRTVAIIGDRSWADSVQAATSLPPQAARLGLRLDILVADSPAEAQAIFDRVGASRYDAWCVPRSYLAVLAHDMLVRQFRTWGKPSVFGATQEVREGAQMSYSLDIGFVWPTLVELIARVGAGEAAGSIPVIRPQRFVLAVRTGEETGVPPADIDLVRRADIVLR